MGRPAQSKDRDEAIKKYQSQTQEAMKTMADNMDKATKHAINTNNQASKKNIEEYEKFKQGVKSANIYGKAFDQGSKMASGAAAAQGAQAQTAARNAGMSKAAAAEMGANASNAGFNNALQSQQALATNTLQNQMNTYGQAVGSQAASRENAANRNAAATMQGAQAANQSQMYGADAQGKAAGLWQGAGGQDYDQSWGTLGAVLSSDANLKTFYPQDDKEDKWAKVDAILAKHRQENK